MKARFSLLLILALVLLFPTGARADGIIIPPPPPCDPACPPLPSPMAQLIIRYHKVNVTIQDQVAVTHVDQVFYNPNTWAVEGTYMFPLPTDAAVSSFSLWVDGQKVEGKILDADQARRTYQEIVSRLRDPALLEYAGRGAVQAHVFPIPPRGERRIELEYTQALPAENGLVRYVYPLSTEKFSARPIESVSIRVEARSSVPVRAVYSPSHKVDVRREGDYYFIAGYEGANVLPDSDFALYYSQGKTQAFHLLTYRDPAEKADPDGFFLLLLAPEPESQAQAAVKDVLLVLDRSGSMDGDKFRQAQDALRYVLQHLNPEDRFNIITFSTGLETYAPELRPAVEASQALTWVDSQSAQGSTDIHRALLEAAAMSGRGRPTYLIFLTDGLPTEGVIDSQQILDDFQRSAPSDLRLFTFGVGYDVDTFLLDSLAQAHHGTSTYVLPGERLDEALSAFYAKISTPVLTDLSLDFGRLPAYDLYPSPLPDLFKGSQIVLVGRYRLEGSSITTDVRLTGQVNGRQQQFTFPEQYFPERTASDPVLAALPRLWATRKIGYLLNQLRLKGSDQETIDQIVHLSIRYGIVTPYTSYLVTEPMPLGAAQQEQIARDQFSGMQSAPTAPSSGAEAVQKAASEGAMGGADAPAAPMEAAANQVHIVGARTFVLSEGKWIDTAFDPSLMQTVKVAFLSPDYFKLVEARPDLAAAFALGQNVIAMADGAAYEVVPDGSAVSPVEIPALEPTAAVPPTSGPQADLATAAPLENPTTAPLDTPVVVAVEPSAPAGAPPVEAAPQGLSCLGGLLPVLLAAAWLLIRRR